jgi:CO/xanthine dehydrogenase Mo-binding subunit
MTDQSVSPADGSFRIGRRSLRFQIVLILLALLAVSFVLVAAVTAVFLHRFLLDRLDQQLAAAGNRFAVALEHANDHDTDNAAPFDAVTGQATGTLGARIVAGRVNLAGAVDARLKLQELAAAELGGAPADYALGNERVFRRDNPSRGLTYAQAAARAIVRGGKYDGHELPDDIHPFTKKSAAALAGLGLMGVAKDTYPRNGDTYSFVVGFAEVEVDVETGHTRLIDYLAVGDVGTVINPRSLHGQLLGGINLGIGHALQQKWVYDQHYGVPLAKRFYHNKPLTILDIPAEMHTDALGIADPETPVGARGVGEPPVGAGFGSVLNAIADALGEDVFRRAPVTLDIVLTSLEQGRRMHEPLMSHL